MYSREEKEVGYNEVSGGGRGSSRSDGSGGNVGIFPSEPEVEEATSATTQIM